jgi:hypothetical protein
MTASIFYSNGINTMPSSNSVTQFLDTVLRVEQNSFEILTKLSQIVAGSSQTVQVSVENTDGSFSSYELPSIGFLQNEIKRIDKNFTTLSGMDGEAIVRMPDGSYKKLIEARLFKEPAEIGALQVPVKFYNKPNWFFENFLSPLLFVNFDVSRYVDFDLQQVYMKRVILNTVDDAQKSYFDNTYKGKNEVDHDALLKDLAAQKIGYFVDEDIVNLPNTIVRFSGNFTVVNVVEEVQQTLDSNNVTVNTKVTRYVFDKISYTDNLLTTKDSMTLKVGDKLDLDDLTQFEITFIDSSTNKVGVKKLSGVDSLGIGSRLTISPIPFSVKNVQINIGFNEREVLFVKPIDKNFNVTTRNFSPGVAIYTNDLTIDTPDGTLTLEEYYNSQVSDFSKVFLGTAKEKPIPAVLAVTPDSPVLSPENFKVVLVNSQKLDTSSIDEIKKKTAQKNSVSSEISQLDIAIEKKKQELNTSKFNSDAERNAVKNQLDELIREKTAKSNLYASLVQDLSTIAQNPPSSVDSPKYRIRGFWPIPAAKVSENTSPQNVVQFLVSYRYLSLNGNAPGSEQYDFVDNAGKTVRAYFSNWVEFKTELRKKTFDATTGVYKWSEENVQDADVTNINQLDIPISKGEKVEIRIKSISEAGWPMNPQMSDWSSSIVIDFPAELEQEAEIETSLKQADAEQIRVQFNQDLAAKGVDTHLSTSFVQKDKYYAHTADAIASGFFNADGSIIDLYNKLKELENNYNALKAMIEKAKGVLNVTVVDPNGTTYAVSNNSTVSLFSGYYLDRVNALPAFERKGAILTDIYKVVIKNSAASPLQLASSYPGGLDQDLPVSSPSTSDKDYDISRRYDLGSLSLSGLRNTSTRNGVKYQTAPFQSSQVPSQYVYVRYTDIGLKNPLIDADGLTASSGAVPSNFTYYPDMTTAGTQASFVWNGSYTGTAPNGNGFVSEFCIHVDHPEINDGSASSLSSKNMPTFSTTNAVYPKFVQAYAFERDSSVSNSNVQSRYCLPGSLAGSVDSYPVKLGFYNDDRYLIGKKTCGSYLYLSPASYADVLVNGSDYRAIRSVEFGDENAIEIPVIFQFRMTDYYGTSNTGTGRIGGVDNVINLTYVKKMGLDVLVKDESTFSFDLQISAKYKTDTPSQTSVNPVKNAIQFESKVADYFDRFNIV